MDCTKILYPFDEDADRSMLKSLQAKRLEIDEITKGYSTSTPLTFEEFLSDELKMSYSEYEEVLRSNLKRPTLFLRRDPAEVHINGYNPDILRIWQANMDIQPVLDGYAVGTYIASYMMKSQRGMSKVMQTACQTAKEGGMSIKDSFRHVGNSFLRASEISAQEAVYLTIGLPMRGCSRKVEFVNTSRPTQRLCILKSPEELRFVPDYSTDVVHVGAVGKYATRMSLPGIKHREDLAEMYLAKFVSWYDRDSQ